MWLVLKLFGVEVVAFGIGGPHEEGEAQHYISNSGGSFELAPEEMAEYEEDYEECRFGFR